MNHILAVSRLGAWISVIGLATALLTSCENHDKPPTPLTPGEREQIAQQIPGRNLSLNPPKTGEVGIAKMSNPADAVNAVLTVKYEEPLPPSLKIILDEKVVTLHDDGKGSDQKAGDGVYSAEVMADFSGIEQNNSRIESLAKGDDQTSLLPVFQNRALTARIPMPFLRFNGSGIIIIPSNPPAGPSAVKDNQSLTITDVSVVQDPTRTYDGCSATGSMGKWTFGYLMQQMANQSATGTDPSTFVANWLQTWMNNQTVNGFGDAARTQINSLIMQPWITRSGGPGNPLNLALAPFRLLAIVNRLDLRTAGVYGGGGNAGEGRLVFGVMDQNCNPQPFTVIFEYGVPLSGCPAVKSWAQQWESLSSLTLGTAAYNNALEAITDQFTGAGENPAKPGGSALDQLRTDERALTLPWELREFHLMPASGTQVQLQQATVAQTPESTPLNGSTVLGDYINANQAAIDDNTYAVPAQFPPGTGFLGSSSVNQQDVWNASNIAVNATSTPPVSATLNPRHFFALDGTCNGCHGRETATAFLQIANRTSGSQAALSGFLTGEGPIPDPVISSITYNFNDLLRRAVILDQVANQSCIIDIHHLPMHDPD
jgi:hypothetical protein